MKDFRDEDLTFFMGLYRDRGRAQGALRSLRKHFPGARVIIRSDGDEDPKNRNLAERYDAEYREEERLYPIENGGAMIARILELHLDRPTKYLFKIDTDTGVHHRFRFLPAQSGVFSTLQRSKLGCVSIQGGCMGFSEDVPVAILDSGLLKDPRLKNPEFHSHESDYFEHMAKSGKTGALWFRMDHRLGSQRTADTDVFLSRSLLLLASEREIFQSGLEACHCPSRISPVIFSNNGSTTSGSISP